MTLKMMVALSLAIMTKLSWSDVGRKSAKPGAPIGNTVLWSGSVDWQGLKKGKKEPDLRGPV